MSKLDDMLPTANAIEQYAEAHMFDSFGLMMSSIDINTNRPFDRQFITENKVPRRAMFDPWSFWTYEDSIMTAGHYIDGLVIKYELFDDKAALDRAREVWGVCCQVYYQSCLYGGIGAFLRPYGGFDEMEKFGEPLGTDQAAPLLCGVYRLMRHVDSGTRAEMALIMMQTLRWYADQGYCYRYYKSLTIGWCPSAHHGASFYLPAIALAAAETGKDKWKHDLDFYLNRQLNTPRFTEATGGLARGFKQGGLLVLKDILGPRFHDFFTPDKLQRIYADVQEWLSEYTEAGMLKRVHPESAEPGFRPYMKEGFDRYTGMGSPFYHCVHAGRVRPRQEVTVLASLACLGIEGAAKQATDLFALRRSVPRDFMYFLADDYEALPKEVHLYARSVGAIMLEWWRNYWILRSGNTQGS